MNGTGPQFEPPLPPRRKNRLIVIAAPTALLVLVVLLFNAIGSSCAVTSCTSKPAHRASTRTTADTSAKQQRFYRVAASDSMGSIAEKFDLSIDEIKACNPNVDPNALQIGTKLRVERDYCKKAYENAPI